MRLVARSGQSFVEQRREQSRRKRAAAETLGSTFPAVEKLRIGLSFLVATGQAPAVQSHSLYPPAPAYFEFACPYGNCDGGFDLNDAALQLVTHSTPRAEGTLQCSGSRTGTSRQPCGLFVHYRITAQYETKAGSTR